MSPASPGKLRETTRPVGLLVIYGQHWVLVAGHRDGRMVELTVTDGCGGIAKPDLERVFDVAWRGSPARTPEPYAGA